VILAAAANGDAVGQVRLEIAGEEGAAWVNRLATRRPEENEADARSLLAAAIPGATFSALGLKPSREGCRRSTSRRGSRSPASSPATAGLELPARHAARPAHPRSPGGRTLPMVLTPEVTRSVWRIQLPEGACPRRSRIQASRTSWEASARRWRWRGAC